MTAMINNHFIGAEYKENIETSPDADTVIAKSKTVYGYSDTDFNYYDVYNGKKWIEYCVNSSGEVSVNMSGTLSEVSSLDELSDSEWRLLKFVEAHQETYYYVYANDNWVKTSEIMKSNLPSEWKNQNGVQLGVQIKNGSEITFDLSKGSMTLYASSDTPTSSNEAGLQVAKIYGILYGDEVNLNDYLSDRWHYVYLLKNEAGNQIVAYLGSQWMGNQTYAMVTNSVVAYKGDVSSLSDTSTILNKLGEITFTLNNMDTNPLNGDGYTPGYVATVLQASKFVTKIKP